jgi:hypothetical protein
MNKMFEKYFISCPKGHLVDSAAERGQSFSERNLHWGFAPVKRRYE